MISRLETHLIDSIALNRAQPVAVLPPSRLTKDGRCFTLLLLHGTGGRHASWPDNTRIAELVADLPVLVVMPSAENAFYLDSEVARMETYLCRELLPWIDGRYPTIASPEARGLTGLSMGGYGALLLALRNPGLFGAAASHSGAVLTSRATTEIGVRWEPAERLYGVGAAGEIKRREHDILALAEMFRQPDDRSGKLHYSGPALYLDCGTEDFLYYASRELTQAMRMLAIPYEYHESRGDHDWNYWRERLPQSLNFHCRQWGLT